MKSRCYLLSNGDGPEFKASVNTRKCVFKSLVKKYDVENIILKTDDWLEKVAKISPQSFCFLATHGSFGEDGTLQKILEENNIRHTHSAAMVCSILANKHKSKLKFKSLNLPTPNWYYLGKFYGEDEKGCQGKKPHFWIEKPINGGSKMGIKKSKNSKLVNRNLIFEDYIDGNFEVSVSVLRNIKEVISLAPLTRSRFLFGSVCGEVDARISDEVLNQCSCMAKEFYIANSCNGIIKVDFLIDKKLKPWAIEVDAIPGLALYNAATVSAQKIGLSYDDLISKIIIDIPKL